LDLRVPQRSKKNVVKKKLQNSSTLGPPTGVSGQGSGCPFTFVVALVLDSLQIDSLVVGGVRINVVI